VINAKDFDPQVHKRAKPKAAAPARLAAATGATGEAKAETKAGLEAKAEK
jgi:hypothetical protein